MGALSDVNVCGRARAALTRAQERVVVVAPASAIQAALCEAAADVRLSSLALRLRAAADALGLPQHQPQRFEAIVHRCCGRGGRPPRTRQSGPAPAQAPLRAGELPAADCHCAEQHAGRPAGAAPGRDGRVAGAQLGRPPAGHGRCGCRQAPAGRGRARGAGTGSVARFGTPHEQRAPGACVRRPVPA